MLLSGLALVSVSPLKFSVPKAAHRFEAGKYSSPFFLTQVLILLCLVSSLFLILARKSQWLYKSCLDWLCVCVCVCARVRAQLCPTLCDPHGCNLQPASFLCPWNFPGKNTGVGYHFFLQGIFQIQESNSSLLHLLHWQANFFTAESPGKSAWTGLISSNMEPWWTSYHQATTCPEGQPWLVRLLSTNSACTWWAWKG